MVERVAWVDAPAGASGDLLLGALVDAGVPIGVLAEAIEKVAVGELHEERVQRGGVAGTCCRVEVEVEDPRSWREIEALLAGAGLHEDVRSLAHDVFARLAEAEGRAQGVSAEAVHFSDVGSPKAIAEVVGVCAGVVHLRVRRLVASPGPAALELSTPIGSALLTTLADDWGPEPEMTVSDAGVGATSGEPEGPLLRLSVGESHPRRHAKLGES
jgi:uncharacterized protein (DUF111 family)